MINDNFKIVLAQENKIKKLKYNN